MLAPYDYFLNENIRCIFDLAIQNSVILFDEAHNIENKAEDCYSYKLSLNDITIVKKYIKMHGKGRNDILIELINSLDKCLFKQANYKEDKEDKYNLD